MSKAVAIAGVLENNESNHDSNNDEENGYFDKDRISFFNSLKPVGTCFALVRKSNGDPTFLMYEGLDNHDSHKPHLTRSNFTRNILGHINAAASTLRVRPRTNKKRVVRRVKRSSRLVGCRDIVAAKQRTRTRISSMHAAAGKEIICKFDDRDYGDDSNRAYNIYLRDLSESGNGNVDTSSDSDLQVLDKDPECSEWRRYTPLADSNMEDDDLLCIGECSKPENPQFRKDVEDILRRRYDDEEYETLWLQVNSRKPMQGYRELRGNLKAYSKDAMGKSYLDEYFDLRRKLDALETDLPRKLSVLRGFFYYLKNIAGDGIFKPWLDESCLAIVPRTE